MYGPETFVVRAGGDGMVPRIREAPPGWVSTLSRRAGLSVVFASVSDSIRPACVP